MIKIDIVNIGDKLLYPNNNDIDMGNIFLVENYSNINIAISNLQYRPWQIPTSTIYKVIWIFIKEYFWNNLH